MSDAKVLTREHVQIIKDIIAGASDEVPGYGSGYIIDADDAKIIQTLLNQRDALAEAAKKACEVWAYYWDCSRDPGHPHMNEAMSELTQVVHALAAAPKEGEGKPNDVH